MRSSHESRALYFPPREKSHTKNGLVAQLVRALACHARGRGFEPHPSRHSRSASVAQLVEQRTENPRVVGSIPTGGTIYADLAHLVERHLAKVEVAGSSPVIRSKTKGRPLWSAFCFGRTGLSYHKKTPVGCLLLYQSDSRANTT